MIQLYRPGTSALHRLPAAVKLAVLAATAVALSLAPPDPWIIGVALAAVFSLYGLARIPPIVLAAELWRLRWIVLVLGAALWIFVGPLTAWINTGRVVALVLLAGLLTLTTRMGELLTVLHAALRPLRRCGVDVEAVAMTVSLAITMVPVVAGFADQVREAQRARGARLGIRWIVPLMVRTLRHADDVGDALAARGLG
ncbi:CbiQ family ECF transporter T component [Microbacterium sp. NPDC057944]|uniref:CbiQ family ECF transporter T component n=1 Tax=Microbacterium sp. NPDC057944 TaxID=3346286 RepID=UPI0036DDD37C